MKMILRKERKKTNNDNKKDRDPGYTVHRPV